MKRHITHYAIVLMVLICLTAAAAEADLTSLVAHYAFDNNLLDSSGNNYHGTLVGSATHVYFGNDRLGNPDNALWFAGTGGTNSEYIDTGIVNYSGSGGSLTLSAWLWANSGSTTERLIASKTGGSGNRDWNLSLETQGGVNHTVRFRVSGTGSDLSGGYTTTSLPLDQWVHVAAVYQAGAGAQMKIYFNGVEQPFYNATSIPQSRSNNTETIRIGHRAGLNPQQWWAGRMDDFRIYSAALSQAEIETIISGAVPDPPGEVSNPSPSDGAVGVSRLAVLNWTAGSDATSHSVYFGQTNPPALIGNQGGTTYIPDHPLDAQTTYYWQVDAVNSQGTEPGPVWSFTTGTTTARAVWSMDDNAASADVLDSAGGNDGTFYAGATPQNTTLQHSSDRVEGTGSLSFNGTNEYIAIPRNAVLEQGNASTREMTAMAWIKDNSGGAAGWATVFGTGDGGWLLARDGSAGMVGAFWLSNGGLVTAGSSANISDGQWHHVAITYTGSAVSLYVNGVGTTTSTSGGTIQNLSDKSVLIGENAGATGRYWQGLIDDVRVYDYAMTAEEINYLLNPGYAWNPSPVDGTVFVPVETTLSWQPGQNALSHDVYFGTDPVAVANAQRLAGDITGDGPVNIDDLAVLAAQWLTDPGAVVYSADIVLSGKVDLEDFAELAADWHTTPDAAFMGNQTATTFDPSTLEEDTTYYWSVDQVNPTDPDSPYTGDVWSFTTQSSSSGTVVSIVGNKWHINGSPPHQSKDAEGLLMNVRMVNTIFEDTNPARPSSMSSFNPDNNTTAFINKISEYYEQGIRAFTVSLQGGMPNYEGAWNSAFNADGTLRQAYMDRAKRVIDACSDRGMVVILSCFYQRQHGNSPTHLPYALSGQTAIRNAVQNVANWIRTNNFQNVVLEIANEYPHGGFGNWNDGSWLQSVAGQVELMNLARSTHPGLLVSTSGLGNGTVDSSIANNADFIILHFNNLGLSTYASRITSAKAYGKPVLCNEDDKLGNDGATAAEYSVNNGCGWGMMHKYTNQFIPFEYKGRLDDTTVYDRVALLTGGGTAPPLVPEISVTITSPNDGNLFNAGSDITIVADPLPGDGETITKVEFFANNVKIGERTGSPWQVVWQNVPAGNYDLTAKATDTALNEAISAPVDIYVVVP